MRAVLLLLFIPVAAQAEPARKLAVLPLKPGHGVEKGVAEVTTEALVTALQREGAQVITSRDIENALGFESEKAKLNVEIARRMGDEVCLDNQACLAEISGALGVAQLVSGSVSRVGSSAVLTAQLFDQRRAKVLERFQRSVKSDDDAAFLELAQEAARALLGRPPAPSPTSTSEPHASPAPSPAAPSQSAGLPHPPSGSPCDSHWRAYLAAFNAIPDRAAAETAQRRDKTLKQSKMMLPLLQSPSDRRMLEFAMAEMYVAEFLYRLRLARSTGRAHEADPYANEALRIHGELMKLPRFARWEESLFSSSLLHYVRGDLRSADQLCRRLPPGFRPKLPTP